MKIAIPTTIALAPLVERITVLADSGDATGVADDLAHLAETARKTGEGPLALMMLEVANAITKMQAAVADARQEELLADAASTMEHVVPEDFVDEVGEDGAEGSPS